MNEHDVCVCPLGGIIDVISRKWALLVINTIGNRDRIRYNQILRSLEGLNPRSLSDRLKELKNAGLINKQVYAEIPPRSEYTLTDEGRELRKALIPLMNWVSAHDLGTEAPSTPCKIAFERETGE